jgi:hypothetical protein
VGAAVEALVILRAAVAAAIPAEVVEVTTVKQVSFEQKESISFFP